MFLRLAGLTMSDALMQLSLTRVDRTQGTARGQESHTHGILPVRKARCSQGNVRSNMSMQRTIP